MRSRFSATLRGILPGATALGATALLGAGCGVERTLQVNSDPPGALVSLNGEEVGRTPMRKMFLWYGTYDLELRKDGYLTKSELTSGQERLMHKAATKGSNKEDENNRGATK